MLEFCYDGKSLYLLTVLIVQTLFTSNAFAQPDFGNDCDGAPYCPSQDTQVLMAIFLIILVASAGLLVFGMLYVKRKSVRNILTRILLPASFLALVMSFLTFLPQYVIIPMGIGLILVIFICFYLNEMRL